jgi:hypothetical protein
MITGLKSQGMKNSPMLFPEQPYPALTKLRPTLKNHLTYAHICSRMFAEFSVVNENDLNGEFPWN